MTEISKDTHPQFWKAAELLYYDNQVPRSPHRETNSSSEDLAAAERGLATLSEEDFEELVYGEIGNAQEIARRSSDLKSAHLALERYFEELCR